MHLHVRVRPFAAGLAALAALAGCSSNSPSDDAREAVADTTEPLASLRACPPAAHYAVITSGAPQCPDVAGSGGAWQATAPAAACVAKTAAADPDSFFCLYTWASSTPDAPPDAAVLETIPFAFVAPIDDAIGDPTCGYGSFSPWLAAEDQAGVACPFGPRGPNGPKGCDVCNIVLYPGVVGGYLVVPSSTAARTVAVGTTNGGEQLLMLDPGTRARAVTSHARTHSSYSVIALPSLPGGVRWVEGPARGYGYDPAPAKP
jgi:hypothetical protein